MRFDHDLRMTRFRARVLGLAISLATAILMLATEPGLAIAWDEGFTLGREERLRLRFQALQDSAAFAARWRCECSR